MQPTQHYCVGKKTHDDPGLRLAGAVTEGNDEDESVLQNLSTCLKRDKQKKCNPLQ